MKFGWYYVIALVVTLPLWLRLIRRDRSLALLYLAALFAALRRLSLAEASSAKPLRIKIVTVGRGDNIERLAARMAVNDRPVERFRVLNGLGANDAVTPGSRVKIVVD